MPIANMLAHSQYAIGALRYRPQPLERNYSCTIAQIPVGWVLSREGSLLPSVFKTMVLYPGFYGI